MYEKPQYLTPDGYKRMASNPLKGLRRRAALRKDLVPAPQVSLTAPAKGKKITPEAAKLVAEAIKIMLQSR